MKINHKAEVRLAKSRKKETINQYDFEKIESLVIMNDRLLKDNKHYHEVFRKWLRPFIEARVPEQVINKIIETEYIHPAKVVIRDNPQDPINNKISLGWLITLNIYDLGNEFLEWRYRYEQKENYK